MLRIGSLAVDPPLFLAPMAGVTDRDFRLIVRRIGGVGVVSMEFISSKGLLAGERRVERLLHFAEEERPIAIQIYGSDAATMAAAAERVEEMGADLCDVNMGCPANKILKGCAGAALMGDLRKAEEIVVAVRQRLSIPMTVKFRLGVDETRNFLDLGRLCEDHGVDAVTLHPRTARQMFRGESDLASIAELKQTVRIPVIGNGDVLEADHALRMFRVTGCDGVMVGRGATRNPWIFRQIAARLGHGRAGEPTLAERRQLITNHFRTVVGREEPRVALGKLRTFTGWYSHGLPGGLKLRRQIQQLGSPEAFFDAWDRFFDEITAEDRKAA